MTAHAATAAFQAHESPNWYADCLCSLRWGPFGTEAEALRDGERHVTERQETRR